ncbi:MAG: ribonuclease P protein component [Pseudomonadota bacterium]
MTPPEATGTRQTDGAGTAPAATLYMERLRKRPDFLAAARSRRQVTPGFILQARDRRDASARVRVGFTCSKKLGNAVIRNRAKRRLRALAHAYLRPGALPGWDYVLIGRPGVTVSRDLTAMAGDLSLALARIHGPR